MSTSWSRCSASSGRSSCARTSCAAFLGRGSRRFCGPVRLEARQPLEQRRVLTLESRQSRLLGRQQLLALAQPLAESFAVSCQTLAGNAPTEVSSNLIRVLFSLSRPLLAPVPGGADLEAVGEQGAGGQRAELEGADVAARADHPRAAALVDGDRTGEAVLTDAR